VSSTEVALIQFYIDTSVCIQNLHNIIKESYRSPVRSVTFRRLIIAPSSSSLHSSRTLAGFVVRNVVHKRANCSLADSVHSVLQVDTQKAKAKLLPLAGATLHGLAVLMGEELKRKIEVRGLI
jgi:hypothetical protein